MKKILFLSCAAVLAFTLSYCDKDNGGSTNNNGGGSTTTDKDFVTLGSSKFYNIAKANYKTFLNSGDSAVQVDLGDTFIQIMHDPDAPRKAKSYQVKLGSETDVAIAIVINWGSTLSSPRFTLDGGTYELKRVNNKWVSVLTNGTGFDNQTNKRYSNISLRVTWPK